MYISAPQTCLYFSFKLSYRIIKLWTIICTRSRNTTLGVSCLINNIITPKACVSNLFFVVCYGVCPSGSFRSFTFSFTRIIGHFFSVCLPTHPRLSVYRYHLAVSLQLFASFQNVILLSVYVFFYHLCLFFCDSVCLSAYIMSSFYSPDCLHFSPRLHTSVCLSIALFDRLAVWPVRF